MDIEHSLHSNDIALLQDVNYKQVESRTSVATMEQMHHYFITSPKRRS